MKTFDVAIVGTGHAGAQAAIALRQYGFTGTIVLIGEELELPYERPPLSKDYLAGEKPFDRMLIRPQDFWTEREIHIISGHRIVAVDAEARKLSSAAGSVFQFGHLIWAAGGRARRLGCRGGELQGVHSIRTRADVDALIGELPTSKKVAVVGGGYIGLEAAATLRSAGKEVVLIEAMDRLLARVSGEEVSRFFEREHRRRGVEIRLQERVASIEGKHGRVSGIILESGQSIPADLVVVGIGIDPEVSPLLAAGCAGRDGVDIDEFCQTSLPRIYAVGDCARHSNAFAGGASIRIESVQNAHDQAGVAARAIIGKKEPYRSIPWFWSNQYDVKLQTVGLIIGHDQRVIRGGPEAGNFSVIYLKEGRVTALDCINATKDYVQGRKLILGAAMPDPDKLADPAIQLKELLQRDE